MKKGRQEALAFHVDKETRAELEALTERFSRRPDDNSDDEKGEVTRAKTRFGVLKADDEVEKDSESASDLHVEKLNKSFEQMDAGDDDAAMMSPRDHNDDDTETESVELNSEEK